MNRKLYKVGDRVEIINYGHIITRNDGIELVSEDVALDIIGKTGIICKIEFGKYYVTDIPFKLNIDQLKWLPPIEVYELTNFIEEAKNICYQNKETLLDTLKLKIKELWKIK